MSQSGPPAEAKQAQAAAMTELENAQRRKRAIDTTLANLEASIWAFEGSYLDETAASGGNIIKGFDNYLKPPGTQKQKKPDNSDVDRLFSTSSVTFQQSLAERRIELVAPPSSTVSCYKPMPKLVTEALAPDSPRAVSSAALARAASATTSRSRSRKGQTRMAPPPLPVHAQQHPGSWNAGPSSSQLNVNMSMNANYQPPFNVANGAVPTGSAKAARIGAALAAPFAANTNPSPNLIVTANASEIGTGAQGIPTTATTNGLSGPLPLSVDPAAVPPLSLDFSEEQTHSITANISKLSNEQLEAICAQLSQQGFDLTYATSGQMPALAASGSGSESGGGNGSVLPSVIPLVPSSEGVIVNETAASGPVSIGIDTWVADALGMDTVGFGGPEAATRPLTSAAEPHMAVDCDGSAPAASHSTDSPPVPGILVSVGATPGAIASSSSEASLGVPSITVEPPTAAPSAAVSPAPLISAASIPPVAPHLSALAHSPSALSPDEPIAAAPALAAADNTVTPTPAGAPASVRPPAPAPATKRRKSRSASASRSASPARSTGEGPRKTKSRRKA